MSLFWNLVNRNSVKHGGNREVGRRRNTKIITTNDLYLNIEADKEGKRRPFFSTDDLDGDGKLYLDYLERRKQRKNKKKNTKGYGIPNIGSSDIWGR